MVRYWIIALILFQAATVHSNEGGFSSVMLGPVPIYSQGHTPAQAPGSVSSPKSKLHYGKKSKSNTAAPRSPSYRDDFICAGPTEK